MPLTNPSFNFQEGVVPQSNLSSSSGDTVAGTGSIQQVLPLTDNNDLKEKLLKKITGSPSSTSINPLPQNTVVNLNGVPTDADNSKEIDDSSHDQLVINSVYSLAQLPQVPEANNISNSMYVPHSNTPSSSSSCEAVNSAPVVFVNPQPSLSHPSNLSILHTALTSNKSVLNTNVVKDSVYNVEPLLPYHLGPPLPYPIRPAPLSIKESELIKDSVYNNGPLPPPSTLETNMVKDSIHNIGIPPTISAPVLEAILRKSTTPPASTLETNLEKDSTRDVGSPQTILQAMLRKDSIPNAESNPSATVSSPGTQLSSSGVASADRAAEPTPTDTGSTAPEVVDVEEEDVDDCMVVKIDLTNCPFPIGKRINNLELVIDDSDDEETAGSTEVKEAPKAQKVKSKKKNHKDKSSTNKDNGSVKEKKKTKKPALKGDDLKKPTSDTPATEKISDKLLNSEKALSSSNDDENDSFCPLIMKVENSGDLDEAARENETPVLSDANDESSIDGLNTQTASSNAKGNDRTVTAMDTATAEGERSITGGVLAENTKSIQCKSCPETFPTRLALLNHVLSGHKLNHNQPSLLAGELNKMAAPVVINLDEGFDERRGIQIISQDNPGDQSMRLDEPVVYTDSAVESSEGPLNLATTFPPGVIMGPDGKTPLPPLCVRCECCCIWFNNYSRLMEHLKDEPKCKKFHDETFKRQYGILPQSSRPGASGNKPNITCSSCKRKFATQAMLNRHLNDSPQCNKTSKKVAKSTATKKIQERTPAEDTKKKTSAPENTAMAQAIRLTQTITSVAMAQDIKSTQTATSVTATTKKIQEKTPAEEIKKKNSAPENTAMAQAVKSTKATTSLTTTNSKIDMFTCKVCKLVCKDAIILAKHLQNSYECLKPKETQEKKTNFQFKIQLAGYSDDGAGYSDDDGPTQLSDDEVQTLNRPTEQQEKKFESGKTKSSGQQFTPVTSVKPVLHQEARTIISQPPKLRVEPVQIQPRPPFYGLTPSTQQLAPLTSINPPPYPQLLTMFTPPPAQRVEHALNPQTYFGFTAPGQQVSPVASYKPSPNQEVLTIQPQLPEQRVEPVQAKQNETSFHSAASVQQGAPGTGVKPALHHEPKLIQWQPPEQRVEPVQVKPKEFFFGAAPLFSDTDGSDSSAEENSGESSSSNEDAVVEYKCKHCSNTFAHKSDFKKHLKSHKKVGHSVPKIHCKVCKKKFKDHTGLQAHLLQRRICFLHVTNAYHDSFEKGTNICQMCKKSLPSAVEFSKHCYKSLTCRLRYIDLVLQNIKKSESSSASLAASSGSLLEPKTNPQASSHSHNENSSSGSVLAVPVVSNTQDKALLGNNMTPVQGTMQNKIDPAVQATSSPNVQATSSPNASNSKICHCCNTVYKQFVQHITNSKKCLLFYEKHPELQPAENSFCFKCRRKFRQNLARAKHFCTVYDYECFECGLRYANFWNLKTHYKLTHPGLAPKTLTQPTSSSSCSTASGGNSKEAVSLTAFPFNCLICFAQFQTLLLLMEHSYVHTEEIPFVCTRCNTTFHHYNRYVSHQAYHMRMDKDLGPLNQDSVLLNSSAGSAVSLAPSSGAPQPQIETGEATKVSKESALKPSDDQNKTNPYKCYICLETLADFETYKTHVSLHSKVSYISCTVCFENFPSQKALKEHSKQHEISRTNNKNVKKTNANSPADLKPVEKKILTCLFCHLVFTDQKNKFDHLAQSVSCKSIMSYVLEKQFFVHPSMNQNMPFKSNQCVFCDEYFPDVVAHIIQTSCLVLLEAGITKYRSDSTKQNDKNLEQVNDYACDICNKRFEKQLSLESHKLKMHKVPPTKSEDKAKSDSVYLEEDHLYCFRCKKYFSDAKSVREHSQLSHRLMSKKVKACMSQRNDYAMCTLCKKRFPLDSNRRLILAHMFKEHNEGSSKLLDFCCNVDNDTVGDEISKLKYSCTICGAILTSSARSSHGQMHIKNFISQLLVKSTKAISAFSIEKCPICKQINHSRRTMKLHLMRHKAHSIFKPLSEQKGAGENSLKLCACPECKRWFASEQSLNFHIKKCHSGSVEESSKSSSKNLPAKKTDTVQRKGNVEIANRAHSPKQTQAAELSTYICKLCSKSYTSISNFRSHLNKAHKILKLSNISDFMKNKETENLKGETTDSNVTELIRTDCLPGFTLKMTCTTCINCHICEASVVAQEYQYHLKNLHGIYADQLYECPHCSLKFPFSNLLPEHQYQCQLNCTCLICKKQTSTVKGFRRHLSQRHEISLSSYTNSHFPCELIKVVNDGLKIEIADSRRSCLACGATFLELNEYRRHVMSHVMECSVVLEDYFSMVQTDNASHADDVPREVGLVNVDRESMPTLEEVKTETAVQTTGATSDTTVNINSDVADVQGYGYEILHFLSPTDNNVNSSTTVPETDMPKVLTTVAHNEQHSTLPIKSEFVASSIDLTFSDTDPDDDDFDSSADTIVGGLDAAQSSKVFEQRVERKRSSSSEIANDPKRRKPDEAVSTLREHENEPQMSANNFLHDSSPFETDQSHKLTTNSVPNPDHFDTEQSHVQTTNSVPNPDHFDTEQSHVQTTNSVPNPDHFDTEQSHVQTTNSVPNPDHFDTEQSHMPTTNSVQNSEDSDNFEADQSHISANNVMVDPDHFVDTDQSKIPATKSMETADHFETDQSLTPASTSVKSADHFDTDRNVFSAIQDNFLF